MVSSALAQVSPPGDPPPPEPDRKVMFAAGTGGDPQGTLVQLLQYDPNEVPTAWGTPGTQHAKFFLSLSTLQKPPNCSGPLGYQWHAVRTNNQGDVIPLGWLAVDLPGDSPTAVGHAYAPGVYKARCSVKFRDNTTLEEFVIDYTGDCAVIGGPIDVSVIPGREQATTWAHDLGKNAYPWYIQYFGYSHWNPPSEVGTTLQRTQDARVSVLLQPYGTELYWDLPAPLDSFMWSYNPMSDWLDVFAEGPSDPVRVRCYFALEFVGMWGDMSRTEGWDNTESTPNKAVPRNADGTWVMKTAYITCHKPHDTVLATEAIYPIVPPPGGAACGRLEHRIWLYDQRGEPMPGVFVQERIEAPLPPGFRANGIERWFTRIPGAAAPGSFGPDSFFYVWTSPPFPTYQLQQRYFAATTSPDPGDPGVFVGVWQIGFNPGPPGLATHTKQGS